ncbi:MAG TPA: GDP-mannose 4,6-dehydratase [Methanotrichaceae archaeon]|nr:GDP-mannose 4,6-dehydratase [Methanotrichaceae archaeon]
MTKAALITGITGQDGSYLAELLLNKGYEVYGLARRLSTPNMSRINHIADNIIFLEGDLTDQSSLNVAMQTSQPDEVYNLAAQSFVATSWNQPVLTGNVTGLGVTRVLDAVKNFCHDAKFYQASSSEMFGNVDEVPQNELTRFCPRSPYAIAKVYGYYTTVNHRESYEMFCCNGILFNHESPRRGIEFVTKKITDGVARIHQGLSKELRLGNLDAKRDWGYAGDYVEAMWLMLQQEEPDDYVIATGESHSVREFVEMAFSAVGLDWRDHVKMDERFMRPAEVPELRGDASKARDKLGWMPETSFEELVEMMVKADLEKYEDSKKIII